MAFCAGFYDCPRASAAISLSVYSLRWTTFASQGSLRELKPHPGIFVDPEEPAAQQ